MNSTWAIILAAGAGSRMADAAGTCKQFIEWRNRPVYWHSALAMSRSGCIDGLVFVLPPDRCESESVRIRRLALQDSLGLAWKVAPGGKLRQESARRGLNALPANCRVVLIHDAARCFVEPALIRAVAAGVNEECPAVVPAIAVTDTIKEINSCQPELAARSLCRDLLRAVQTPQGFLTSRLRLAYSHADAVLATDDATLMESVGQPVCLIPGSQGNAKLTNPEDMRLLMEIEEMIPCAGFGYDVHRYGPGRPLKLGGILVPGDCQVIAHSDGDVLLHSLMDALLGSAALGDIGGHFPDSDPAWEGASSAVMLDQVLAMIRAAGIRVCHVDLTVVAQKPRLKPYAGQIRNNVARLLGLTPDSVNFKATTEEGLGFTGSCEGIKAYALTSCLKSGSKNPAA